MKKLLLLLIFYGISQNLSAQERELHGILEDNGEPLLFATVAVYRDDILISGVETDLDGKYTILCQVGDRLEFSYIGYTPKSIIVTEVMLSGEGSAPKLKIERIKSKAFKKKMKDRKLKASRTSKQKIKGVKNTVDLPNKYLLNKPIIGFSVKNGKIELEHPKPDIEYDLAITQNIGMRAVAPWHLHELQNTFSQGRPLNGILEYRDQTTGESHSFGPKISELGIDAYDNNLLQPSIVIGTNVRLEAERNHHKIYALANHNTHKDIFNKYGFNNTNLRLGYIKFKEHKKSNLWNIDLKIHRTSMDNHNYNGYYQKALQAMMVQSPSFDSRSKAADNNAGFSPKFNHPKWYLDNNNNPVQSHGINLAINHKWTSKNAKSEIINLLNLDYKKTSVAEHMHKSTLGSNDVYSRTFNAKIPSAILVTKLKRKRFRSPHITLELDNLATIAQTEFLGEANNELTYDLLDQLRRNTTTPRVVYQTQNFKFAVSNSSILSNNQPINLVNPAVYLSHDFNSKKIDKLRPYIGVNRITKEQDLLLDRYNYSSFLFSHHELQSQYLNVPLWLPDNLKNEIKDEYKIGLTVAKQYSHSRLRSTLEYKFVPQKNVIFPIMENGDFVLKNAVDFTTQQITWSYNWDGSKYLWSQRIAFDNTFELNHFTTKVNKLHTTSDRIPIAGFEDISKNLIVDQPVGVIVGSDYERNAKGEVIIDQNGFPSKTRDLKVIADPTPLLNFNYDLKLYINHFSFKILIDGQIGGKVWNGTQQTLDYYGVSQYTAEQRTTDDYIFDGVYSDGTQNNTKVSLADPQQSLEGNQWTRYGEDGIASEYIKDASHISLKSIEISYWKHRYDQSNYKLTMYARNVLTLASFKGFTTSHLFEDSMSYGLQYFNQPIATEIGTSLTYNF